MSLIDVDGLGGVVAGALLSTGAVRVSLDPLFTWTSGIKSPIYCDNRLLIGFTAERKMIVDGFAARVRELGWEFEVVAGTATAGIPWAAFLAYALDLPMVYIRPEPKGHGAGKQIEGFLEKGAKVLLIEDLISTGGSSMKAVRALRNEAEAEVVGVGAIMNYELDKSKVLFENEGVKLFSLTNFTVLMELAKRKGLIEDVEGVRGILLKNLGE